MPIGHIRTLFLSVTMACSVPLAASAQTTTPISPGMQVVDPSGAPVGAVTTVRGDQLIVKTDKHEVLLPVSSFTPSQGKLLFALTQAQLNAQTDQAVAEANAKLVAGTSVYGPGGNLAGTIDAIDETNVTLKLASGQLVRMPRSSIAPNAQGAVLGISAAELQRLAEQAR